MEMEGSTSDSQIEQQSTEQPETKPITEETVTLESPIAELGLRTRAKNVLNDAGFYTVNAAIAALEQGDEALLSLKGFGPKSLEELKTRLQEHNFRLPGGEIEEAPAPREEAPQAEAEAAQEDVVAAQAPPPVEKEEEEEEEEEAERVGEPPLMERLRATLALARERMGEGAWTRGVYALIALLVIAASLLPPVSLLQRLGIVGYTAVNAENSSISHPDGLTLSVDPESFTGKLRVRLGSVPRLEFLEGSAGGALRRAVEALPDHLAVKSPLYQIKVRGNSEDAVMIDAVLPNDAEPWQTLDLYTWTGEAWEWVGSELHNEVAEEEYIRARVTDVPANIVVVQSGQVTPTVSASLGPDDNAETVAGVLDEANPTGLLLGTDGGFVGDPASVLPPAEGDGYVVLPALRNWAPGASINRGLLTDLLIIPEIQESHIANILHLCEENGFAGVEIDYRGVSPDQREAYTAFIAALADALHAEGLRLSLGIEPPTPTDGSWDTEGYDWQALGAIVDAVKVPFPEDPTAYVEGGEAERLLDWATAQVPRHKLRMQVSSLSVERTGEGVSYVSLEQALATFGEVTAMDDVNQVEPGSEVEFGLSGPLLSIAPQESGGTYRLEYRADEGETGTVWLGTAANLAHKLSWARKYHLGGVAVADMLASGNAPGIVDAVSSYRAGAAAPAGREMEVVWTVSSEAATLDQQVSPLTEPGYVWTVMASPGSYAVNATVAGFDHGSLTVDVVDSSSLAAQNTLTETDTVTLTAEGDGIGGGEIGEADEECLNASYVADVSVPDNTQFDNEEEFEKTWRVRNSGTCSWPENTVLAFSTGSQMGASDSVEVGALEPGEQTEITVKMKSPVDAGRYTGTWRMKTEDGFFGSNLTVVIQAGEVEEGAEIPAPVVAPISGGPFELGGHITNHGLPYAQQMHYAGMTWVKDQVHYGADASGLIGAAHANDFKVQLSAIGGAAMVTEPGFEQNFANWVAGMATAGADAIEIWNEPNIDREWQIGHISPQAYTRLLCTSYNAIKAANPGTAVISAAPSPTGWFGGCGPNGCDDAPWMAGLRDAGAAQCMDYIGAHHNAGATSPSARIGHPANPGDPHHSWFFLPQTELYYNTFGGARKLFYTEMGYASQEGVPTFSDAFAWARGTDNSEQAAWLSEAVQLSVNTGMVRCIIVWNVGRSRYGDDPQDGYNIIRPGGGCPACDALHNLLGTR